MRRAPSQTASERPREVSSPSIRVYRYEAVSKNNSEHRFSQQLCSCNFCVHVLRSAGALGAGGMGEVYRARYKAKAGSGGKSPSGVVRVRRGPSSSIRAGGTRCGRAEPSEHSYGARHRRRPAQIPRTKSAAPWRTPSHKGYHANRKTVAPVGAWFASRSPDIRPTLPASALPVAISQPGRR